MPRILVVDDSKAIRKAIRRILESLGFTVDEAEDGQKALDYCKTMELPGAILLDIDMPVMDGMSFLQALRQDHQFDGCIVVMCTTHNAMPKIQEAIACGANEYIMKPFTDDIIMDKLRQVGLVQ